MVRLLRLIRGYVVFMITGSYPERFVNILTYNGVTVWGVRSKNGVVYCCTAVSNYRQIRRLSRRTSAKVRIKYKRGLPFIINRNRDRVGLAIGAVCFVVVFKILSMFVWNIDIYGFEKMSYSNAKDVLQRVGVYEGAYGNYDSLKNIQTRAMIEFGNVSWITVNVNGSRGEVNITETTQQEAIKDENPYNIKAKTDGQIIRVDAYSGMAVVGSGDAVVKGNLLISGFVQTELGGTHLDTADGIVWASTEHTENFVIPKQYTTAIYSGDCRNRYSCRLFNLVIPLTFADFGTEQSYFTFISENKAKFREETASVSLINESIYYYEKNEISATEKMAEDIFKTEMLLCELFNYGDRKIVNRIVERSDNEKNYEYTVKYECEEDIAERTEILMSENFVIEDNEEIFGEEE